MINEGMSELPPYKPQPWRPADATDFIRRLSLDPGLTLDFTVHARDQMQVRDLIVSDVLHVLKHGFVYETPEQATQVGCFKYKIETSTPAGPRVVRVVAIPWASPAEIKIVTVMWRDE